MRYNDEFEWDEQKNNSNSKKHGVAFEEAATLWNSSYTKENFDSEHSTYEDRFMKIGPSRKGRILIVIFTENNLNEKKRIISARLATTQERGEYEEGI